MSDFNLSELKIDSPILKVKELVPQIQESILNGNVDAAKLAVVLKKYNKLWEELTKGEIGEAVKDVIYEQTLAYKEGNTKTIKLYGANIVVGSVRTWYDFTETNDPLWNELTRLEKKLGEMRKKREDELKLTIPSDNQLTLGIQNTTIQVPYDIKVSIKQHGEKAKIVTINAPIKKSIDGLKYSV